MEVITTITDCTMTEQNVQELASKLYDAFKEQIRRKVKYRIKRQEEIDDVVAEVYLAIVDSLHKGNFDTSRNAGSYIHRIVENKINTYFRQRKNRLDKFVDIDVNELQDNNSNYLEIKSNIEAFKNELSKLKNNHREVLKLRYFEGLSYGEIAKAIGSTEKTVGNLIRYATDKLKKNLKGK
ncbi:MAG TPA: RNA polymerase sigma factor [bacterium]|nr:RNA polymerase sigma factor [Ignavibacteriaceae bacterium]HMY35896.1 RNA polymerase sigma factor [bacterium]HMZ03586.1 RNA polymerase sigma factor [bacterium]HNB10114.1 RNA polymerase sigma factor [bacterium]HND78008.1 RNA polymerase sigma factor [bacterium]